MSDNSLMDAKGQLWNDQAFGGVLSSLIKKNLIQLYRYTAINEEVEEAILTKEGKELAKSVHFKRFNNY